MRKGAPFGLLHARFERSAGVCDGVGISLRASTPCFAAGDQLSQYVDEFALLPMALSHEVGVRDRGHIQMELTEVVLATLDGCDRGLPVAASFGGRIGISILDRARRRSTACAAVRTLVYAVASLVCRRSCRRRKVSGKISALTRPALSFPVQSCHRWIQILEELIGR